MDPVLLRFQLGQLPAECPAIRMPVHHHIHNVLQLALDDTQLTRQLATAFAVLVGELLSLLGVGLDGLGDDIRRQEMLAQRHEHTLLDLGGFDRPGVRASLGILEGRAAHALVLHDGVGAAAAGALEQARQQPSRATPVMQLRPAAGSPT